MWSKELLERTRNEAYEGAMMKRGGFSDDSFGMIQKRDSEGITIVAVEMKSYMPVPTSRVIAQYKDVEEMIAAGWVID